jgi:hypothetical protein
MDNGKEQNVECGLWNAEYKSTSNTCPRLPFDKLSPFSADSYRDIFITIQSALTQMAADMANLELI